MGEKRTLTVVVGAGASHNCVDQETNKFRTDLTPPLVQDLFENRDPFNVILRQYPKAEALSATIRSRLRRKEQLESVLKGLAAANDLSLKKQFWHIPLYLQHLFYTVSNYYVTGGGTKYQALVRAVQSQYAKVLYLTVNYDLFLDHAIQTAYGVTFDSLDSYWQDQCVLGKLHGSVNWGKAILNYNKKNVSPDGDILMILETLESDLQLSDKLQVIPTPVFLTPGGSELPDIEKQIKALGALRRASNPRVTLYPALSVPIEGKTDFHISEEQLENIRAFLRECSDFLVIGFSGLDEHVVKLFRDVAQVKKLEIVNGDRAKGVETLEEFAGASEAFKRCVPKDSFPRTWLPLDGGFARFVDTGELDSFLSR